MVGDSRVARVLVVGSAIAYVAFLVLAPMTALVIAAFADGAGGVVDTFRDPALLSAFGLTLRIGLIAVAIHGLFGTMTAWVLVRDPIRGKSLMNAMIDLPFAVSPVVVGYMLLLLFGRQGVLGPLLDTWGLKVAFSVPGMVLATLFVTLPFMIREVAPVLEAVGDEQERAASTLGAGGWTVFRLITFPAIRWAVLYGMILTMARALGEFGAVLVVGGGVQGSTETATLFIYRALDERMYVAAYSAALLLGSVSLGLVLGTEWLRSRLDRG
jgi:sulfate transport system permease protein